MKAKKLDNIEKYIPDQKILEQRFAFIKNDLLKTNLVIDFRYIIFLILLESEINIPGPIIYTLYKDIILYTANIIESCLNYAIGEFISINKLDLTKISTFKWEYDECKVIYEIDKTEQVVGAKRHKNYEKLNKNTQFKTINEMALNSKLITKELYEKVDYIRTLRNHIHLASLSSTEDFYKKSDVDECFSIANSIINHVENKIR